MPRKKSVVKYYEIQDIRDSIVFVYPSFKEESERKQLALAKAISCLKQIPKEELFTMTKESLEYAGTSLKTVNPLLEKYPLIVWTENKYYKSSGYNKGVAKLYRATPQLAQVMKHYAQLTDARLMVYYQEKGQSSMLRALDKVPSRIMKEDYDAMTTAHVNLKGLEAEVMAMEFDQNVDYHEFLANRLLASAKARDGVLDQYYFRGDTGRLFSGGVCSLQNIPKKLRKTLFSGAYEVDFVNCHYVIASHFTTNQIIQEYAEDAHFYRNHIAEECDMSYKEVKAGLLMLLYGAGTQIQEGKALVEMMGKERTERFLGCTLVKNIVSGIKYLQEELVYEGMMTIPEGKTKAQALSAFLQKHEAMILDVCVKECEAELLLFDGFITYEDVNTKYLKERVFDELKFDIDISKEVIL